MLKTTSQVAVFTGISTRTLQYYDEIGLLKPSQLTPSGYRLYDDKALEKLQQILFFKELGFKLKDIIEILQKPEFDRIDAYKKQKELLLKKRSRIDRLIGLLDKLEKGEKCMSFEAFDLSEYIEALNDFKNQNTDDVVKYWGSVENFNAFIQKVQEDAPHLSQLAARQFGSVEKYTAAMKYNMEHFQELMEHYNEKNTDEIVQKNNTLFLKLTSDMKKDVTSDEIQAIVRDIVTFTENTMLTDVGEGYWDIVIKSYSNEISKNITDKKYGGGASEYIANAFQYYFHKELI